jgi:hypothetical protein
MERRRVAGRACLHRLRTTTTSSGSDAGLDNKNIGLISTSTGPAATYSRSRTLVGLFYLNAFYAETASWCSVKPSTGPGDLPGRQSWNFLAGGLDIIGHDRTA